MHKVAYKASSSTKEFLTRQEDLERVLRELFPNDKLNKNARRAANIISPLTGKYLELDFWFPDKKLCFEFQDPYHYTTTWYANVSLSSVKEMDRIKKKMVEDRGETLISVPCWWDGTPESLVSTIRLRRPDLFRDFPTKGAAPIDPIPPEKYFKVSAVPGVGELMLAAFGVSRTFEPENWWLGEKYDGVRACWHPPHVKLYSRMGIKIDVLQSFLRHFAKKTFLDGEIWFGRGTFHDSQKVMRRQLQPGRVEWEHFRLVVFDCPAPNMEDVPFEERFAKLVKLQRRIVVLATCARCINRHHLVTMANQILIGRGEGVVLRLPKSGYEHGKTNTLYKFKAMREDQEGLIVSEDPDGYCLQLPDGEFLFAKLISSELPAKPKKGDIVMFSFQVYGATTGLPANPKIEKVRTDVTWDDVLRNVDLPPKPEPIGLTQHALFGMDQERLPAGHWDLDDGINLRIFFDKLAKKSDFDPLLARNWYSATSEMVAKEKDGLSVLYQFKGSIVKALMRVYPDIGLDESKFLKVRQNYWSSDNKRKFLSAYAKKRDFDPLVPENWYFISSQELLTEKGGLSVLREYGNQVSAAVIDLFPDIGAQKSKFYNYPMASKDLFDKFAQSQNFDPLVAQNWHIVATSDVLAQKGSSVLHYYNGSMYAALKAAYPHVDFDEKSFSSDERYKKTRTFFKNFAQQKGFDPSFAYHWYPLDIITSILDLRDGEEILEENGGSLYSALKFAFPEMELEETKFDHKKAKRWHVPENRKTFFDDFAKKYEFDPLINTNWYNITTKQFVEEKGGSSILNYYNNSFIKALMEIYPASGIDESKFKVVRRYYWMDKQNRKQFFDEFAKKRKLDPLVPESWYNKTVDEVTKEKGGATVLNMYNRSLVRALEDTYPNLILDPAKFVVRKRYYWAAKANRKRFFDEYAKRKKFDPLVANHWYGTLNDHILGNKGGISILKFYDKSVPKALMDVYPSINWDETKFEQFKRANWLSKENRKKFMDEIAQKKRFNPWDGNAWVAAMPYFVSKGGSAILYYYDGSLQKAVQDLYPNVQF
eukprot:Phypoly_transcript_01438.p1 GENE.Phypoly_transcript_01438~~Phypoly_transcript_01438.p1  ORF type:complete len:1047 (+),score=162.81 Phypoly_transcript_01438:248-3388(+)